MVCSHDRVLEHLIASAQRIDVPRSCALVIQAITLVGRTHAPRPMPLNSAPGKALHAIVDQISGHARNSKSRARDFSSQPTVQ